MIYAQCFERREIADNSLHLENRCQRSERFGAHDSLKLLNSWLLTKAGYDPVKAATAQEYRISC